MLVPSPSVRAAVAGVALTLFLASPVSTQKNPDTRINTDAPGSAERIDPQIAASGSSVCVIWEDRRAGTNVYFNRSLDGGSTWLASDIQVNTSPNVAGFSSPQLVLSGSALHVTWSAAVNGIYFNRSLNGGVTWLPADVQVSAGPAGSFAESPEIAAVGSDVYVAWEDDRFNGGNFSNDIYFNRSLDGGLTWMPNDIRLSTTFPAQAANAFNPVIAASGTSVFVTWDEDVWVSGSRSAYFARSLDQGTTWTSPRRMALASSAPDLAVVGPVVYLVWSDGRNGTGDIYFNRSLDGGTTWLPADVRVNTNPLGTLGPQIPKIAASGSSVYVCWTDFRHNSNLPADLYFNRSLDGGLTWLSSDIRLNSDPAGTGSAGEQQIAASGASVYVAWTDFRNGGTSYSDIYCNRSVDGGTTWLATDVRLNTNPPAVAPSWDPQVAATGSSPHVTWVDLRSWNGMYPLKSDIYFNIPFGFQPYGTATPGSGGLSPLLSGAGSATIGSTPSIDVTNGLGGAAGALFVGVGPASKVSIPILGGTVLVQPTLGLPFGLGGASGVPGAGTASLPLSLPNDPAAVGVNLNFQGVFLDAGAILGISMTNAIEMWIG